MAGVNTMTFEQASSILNNIRTQVTGQDPIAILDTATFTSVGTTLLQAGYDPVLNQITQMISRTVFSIRPYTRKFGGLKLDEEQWGAIVRKLAISDKDWEDNVEFDLVDGESIDMYKVNKPNVLELKFYGANTFSKHITVFKKQLDSAFSSPSEFGRFISMVTQNVMDMIEQCHESIARMIMANFIGGKTVAENGVIHLITEYNEQTGLNLDSTSIYAPENVGDFSKWCYARITSLMGLMTERSQMFQINVEGHELNRHTPYGMQRLYMYAPLLNQMRARVLADTFNKELLERADVEEVNYWQSIETPNQIKVKPNYLGTDGLIKEGEETTVDNVAGILFDYETMGFTTVNQWSAPSPFNASGGYTNVFWHFTNRWMTDYTEKGIILMLD